MNSPRGTTSFQPTSFPPLLSAVFANEMSSRDTVVMLVVYCCIASVQIMRRGDYDAKPSPVLVWTGNEAPYIYGQRSIQFYSMTFDVIVDVLSLSL